MAVAGLQCSYKEVCILLCIDALRFMIRILLNLQMIEMEELNFSEIRHEHYFFSFLDPY